MKLTKLQKKTFHFPIMKSYERKFIHELASYYGFETASHDPEPHRSVSLYASRDKTSLPAPTLMQSVEVKSKTTTMSRLSNIKQLTSDASYAVKSHLKVLEGAVVEGTFSMPLSSTYSVLADHSAEQLDSLSSAKNSNKSDIDYFDFE